MMYQERTKIIVGFLLSVLLGAVLFFVHSRSYADSQTGDFILYANFTKADGLMNGAAVRVAGIPVGHVAGQTLSENYRVHVRLVFNRYLELPEDSSATIETDGLLGEKHLEIIPGGSYELLASGDVIGYTQNAIILGELMDKVNQYMREKKKAAGVILDDEPSSAAAALDTGKELL